MRNSIKGFLSGRDKQSNALIAACILSLFVMGCMCNKSFDLSNLGDDNRNSSNQAQRTADRENEPRDTNANKSKSGNPFDKNNSDDNSSDTASSSDGETPSEAETEALVKETLAQFADALDSGDFSTIYENSSPDFKGSYTEEQMKAEFNQYLNNKKYVVPPIRKAQNSSANFTTAPWIRTEKGLKILVAKGKFPVSPAVNFDFEYVWRNGEWKLLKLVTRI